MEAKIMMKIISFFLTVSLFFLPLAFSFLSLSFPHWIAFFFYISVFLLAEFVINQNCNNFNEFCLDFHIFVLCKARSL
jgi:hypothetical protein